MSPAAKALTDEQICVVGRDAVRHDPDLADAAIDALSWRLNSGPNSLSQEEWESAREKVAVAFNALQRGA